MIKYPKTGTYRDFVKVARSFNNRTVLQGTVKLHGTNGGIRFPECIPQSRNRLVTVEDDNFGFAKFVEDNKDAFIDTYKQILKINNMSTDAPLMIFGELVGKGIQDTVAVSELDKSFFIFSAALVIDNNGCEDLYWLPYIDVAYKSGINIYSIQDFETYTLVYDPITPDSIIDDLESITTNIETECPVGRTLGFKGPGEGVVWSFTKLGEKYSFKVKGSSHTSDKKLKRKVSISPERFEGVKSFVEAAFTLERLDNIYQLGNYKLKEDIPRFISCVMQDVISEEKDNIEESQISSKDVSKVAISIIRKYILEKLG